MFCEELKAFENLVKYKITKWHDVSLFFRFSLALRLFSEVYYLETFGFEKTKEKKRISAEKAKQIVKI